MEKDTVQLMKETCIFYPDALFAGRYGAGLLQNKAMLPFACNDENAAFKASMAYAIAKTIELASIFKRVYLESNEYSFIIRDMIKNQRNIAIYLLRSGRISFVDDHHWSINYKYSAGQSICVGKKDKMNSQSLKIEILKDSGEDQEIRSALDVSFEERIIPEKEVDIPLMCEICENDLRLGYYQFLGITENGYVVVDDGNVPVYDAVLQAYRNNFLCDSYGISAIYNNEVSQYFYNFKVEFLNRISRISVVRENIEITNTTKTVLTVLDQETPFDKSIFKQIEDSRERKELQLLQVDNQFKHLNQFYMCNIKEELQAKIVFVGPNNEQTVIALRSGEDIITELQKEGKLKRSTHLFIKVLPRKYARSFIQNGEIKFSCPSVWVEEGKKGNIGQGDMEEGIIGKDALGNAFYRPGEEVLNNLGFCCYGLDNLMFSKKEITPGMERMCSVVPYGYFKKFYPNEMTDYENEPVILLINPERFAKKLHDALVDFYKIKAETIIMSPIVYIDKNNSFELKCEYPFELFYKGLEFINQNEIRVVIKNDGSAEFSKIFENKGIIQIGDLSDSVTLVEKYNENMQCYIEGKQLVYFPSR